MPSTRPVEHPHREESFCNRNDGVNAALQVSMVLGLLSPGKFFPISGDRPGYNPLHVAR